jgi:hypothetical protein
MFWSRPPLFRSRSAERRSRRWNSSTLVVSIICVGAVRGPRYCTSVGAETVTSSVARSPSLFRSSKLIFRWNTA